MLADLLAKVRDLVTDAQTARIVAHGSFPDRVWVQHGDQLDPELIPPPWREHEINSLRDLIAVTQDAAIARAPEVFYDARGVRVLLDRDDRRQTASMLFTHTQRWSRLLSLAAGESFSVREVMRLLRFELHGTGADKALQALSKVDFVRKGSGVQGATHGKETLGKAVEASVAQAADVPETFKVRVPIYSDSGIRGFTADVTVGLYLDIEAESIELRVLADELESAVLAVLGQIASALRSEVGEVPVFHGSP